MKALLIAAALTVPALAAETKAPPAVAAGRFYAQAKAVNALMSAKRRIVNDSLEYGEKGDLRAMYHTSMHSFLNLDQAGKDLAAAAAALPAPGARDAATKALLALADEELAQADRTREETLARVAGARDRIEQIEKSASPAEKAGLPTISMLLDMLKPRRLPIALPAGKP